MPTGFGRGGAVFFCQKIDAGYQEVDATCGLRGCTARLRLPRSSSPALRCYRSPAGVIGVIADSRFEETR
jgi:hypothetical protein